MVKKKAAKKRVVAKAVKKKVVKKTVRKTNKKPQPPKKMSNKKEFVEQTKKNSEAINPKNNTKRPKEKRARRPRKTKPPHKMSREEFKEYREQVRPRRRRLSDGPAMDNAASAWLQIKAPFFNGKMKRKEIKDLHIWINKVLNWLKWDHNRFGHEYTLKLIRLVEPDWEPDYTNREMIITGSQAVKNLTSALRQSFAGSQEDKAAPPQEVEE